MPIQRDADADYHMGRNWIDTIIVVTGLLNFIPNVPPVMVSTLRNLRAVRPLRLLTKLERLRTLVMSCILQPYFRRSSNRTAGIGPSASKHFTITGRRRFILPFCAFPIFPYRSPAMGGRFEEPVLCEQCP